MNTESAGAYSPGRPTTGLGHYLRDLVYGASDGVVTTLAVVAGAAGAAFAPEIGLILGLANLAADGLSMGASNYLALKSELEQTGASVATERPWRHGLATIIAFVVAGAIPLLSYLPAYTAPGRQFATAIVLAVVTLVVVGAARSRFVRRPAWRCALEMVAITGAASGLAYFIGSLVAPLAH